MSSNQVVLEVKEVTKKVGQQTIVDRLSFKVNKGEVVGLLGPNGAGKTTTIRMIVGLISMTAGDILINSKSVKTDFSGAVSKVGAIIENPEFYGYMSGWDNLKQYQRMYKGISDERIAEVVNIVGLQEALNKKVKNYSLGMRQRLGIAQALLHKPDILILDEPTNGLDPAGIREMRDYVKHIAQYDGIAVLVSSHLLVEMELMCNRVIVIQQGKFVQEQNLLAQENQLQSIVLKVNDVAQVQQLLHEKHLNILSLDEQKREITIAIEEEHIPLLLADLVAANIRVYRVETMKQSLEDEFLKWTGGNQIV